MVVVWVYFNRHDLPPSVLFFSPVRPLLMTAMKKYHYCTFTGIFQWWSLGWPIVISVGKEFWLLLNLVMRKKSFVSVSIWFPGVFRKNMSVFNNKDLLLTSEKQLGEIAIFNIVWKSCIHLTNMSTLSFLYLVLSFYWFTDIVSTHIPKVIN